MRRWFVLILGLVILLSACGQKYDKEIDEVTKLEKESIQDVKNTKKYKNVERSKSYYKIYNDGEVNMKKILILMLKSLRKIINQFMKKII